MYVHNVHLTLKTIETRRERIVVTVVIGTIWNSIKSRDVSIIIVFGVYVDRQSGRIYHSAGSLVDWKFQGAPRYGSNTREEDDHLSTTIPVFNLTLIRRVILRSRLLAN